MNAPRQFSIYLSNGETMSVEAPSLRKAISTAEKEKPAGVEILAALEGACLPTPEPSGPPFLAVLLRNPVFVAPAESIE